MARAARLFGTAAELRSEDFQSPILRGMALRAISREDAAREAETIGIHRAERVLELNPLDGRALSLGAGALVDNGQIERALVWSRRSLELHPDDMSALVNGACVQARVGNRDEALNLLERVFSRGCGQADWIAQRLRLQQPARRRALPAPVRLARFDPDSRPELPRRFPRRRPTPRP